MNSERRLPDERTDRLDDVLDERGLEAVWFARPNSFAWLTGGSNVVDRTGSVGVAAAGYDGDALSVVTDNIEAERLRNEELPEGVRIERYDWHSDSLPGAIRRHSPEPAAADFDVPGFAEVDASTLRQPLTEGDIERYRELGESAAAAVESVALSATATDTEREIAARLRKQLASDGIEAPVALVGGADRMAQYRHATPKDEALGEYAVVSVTAEQGGLFASCTRTVAFDSPEWLSDRHEAAARVEATALAATHEQGIEGGGAADVFEAVQAAYDEVGWDGEWQNHHQGGAAGFAGREWIATPESGASVRLPMAYAWNPTVQGAKSEDTVLVDDSGYETLTAGEWPTLTVEAVGSDETFERPAVRQQ